MIIELEKELVKLPSYKKIYRRNGGFTLTEEV